MTSNLIKTRILCPHGTDATLYFRYFVRLLNFYGYWRPITHVRRSFGCLSSAQFQIFKIRIMIRMRITNILYESTRVRTTNPANPIKDSRIRRIYSNYESSNNNTTSRGRQTRELYHIARAMATAAIEPTVARTVDAALTCLIEGLSPAASASAEVEDDPA